MVRDFIQRSLGYLDIKRRPEGNSGAAYNYAAGVDGECYAHDAAEMQQLVVVPPDFVEVIVRPVSAARPCWEAVL